LQGAALSFGFWQLTDLANHMAVKDLPRPEGPSNSKQ